MKRVFSVFAAIAMAGVVMGQDCPCQNQGDCPMQKQGQKAGHGEKSHRAHKHARRGQKNSEMQKKMEEWKSMSEDERKAKLRERFEKRGQKPEVGEVDIKVFCCAADKKPLTLGGRPNIAPTKNIKFPQWAPKAQKKGHIGGKRHNGGKRHFSFGQKTQKMAAKRPHFGQKRQGFKAPLMGAKAQKPQFGRPVQGGFSVKHKQHKNQHGAWNRVRGFRH